MPPSFLALIFNGLNYGGIRNDPVIRLPEIETYLDYTVLNIKAHSLKIKKSPKSKKSKQKRSNSFPLLLYIF
jgi:hypothetical protein